MSDYKLRTAHNGLASFEDDRFILDIYGEVFADLLKSSNEFSEIIDLYIKYGDNLTQYLFGKYILSIFDKRDNHLSIFQDVTSSPILIYYTVKDNTFYYSNSLKKLLILSDCNRELNLDSCMKLIKKGFIDGERTLINSVYKLKMFHMISVNMGGVIQKKCVYTIPEYSKKNAKLFWENVLEDSILHIIKDDRPISMPLSAGYDSNNILYIIRRYTEKNVDAFSIGGSKGRNEVPIVEEIVKNYKNISLYTNKTDNKLLDNYPDIIWRMEGSVFEIGIFLKYALAKLSYEHNAEYLICGDCANEVMSETNFPINYQSENNAIHIEDSLNNSNELYVGLSKLYKKAGILMNSFGIDSYYPYLDERFIGISIVLRYINGKTKRYQKKISESILPENIFRNISIIGGATDINSILSDKMRIALKEAVGDSWIYKKLCIMQVSPDDTNKYKVLSEKILMYIMHPFSFSYRVISKLRRVKSDKINKKYYDKESELLNLLGYVYLILFDKLFVSGEYDNYFEDESFDFDIETLLGLNLGS